ncbi:hypothetical protein [Riemerella columbina]|uniref:hypothetical protein n=1 Tax=Riemerella columbina TaxID=103810 RepID=UPI00035F099D|nr:hypothetical protein [Riemerella columbina]
MDELDLLKKNWNQPQSYKKYTDNELFKMLKGKSISIAKWVLIIGIIEITVTTLLGYGLNYITEDNSNESNLSRFDTFFNVLDYISNIIPLAFLALLLYLNFKIRNEEQSKKLMERILLTRKVIEWYINLFLIKITLIFILAIGFIGNDIFYNQPKLDEDIMLFMIMSAVFFIGILWAIFFFIFKYIYQKLIYGKMLKQLKTNYQELSEMDY